jgi:hypothetical protein
MNARYRIYADEHGYCSITDMGNSWGASVSGIEFTNGDTPLAAGETIRYGRDWVQPDNPIWEGSEVREMTEAEQGVFAQRYAEQVQAYFVQEVQAFLAEHQANVIKFFTAMAHFPAITLPTTYDAALDSMHEAIMAATAGDQRDTLDSQSRIAQDLYRRLLEPNEWTGARLAQLAAVMQGGE